MKIIVCFIILFASLLFPAVTNIVKARIVGRKGPSFLQPIYDVIRLFKKGSVYSKTTSIIFRIAPIIYFASVVTALTLIPFGRQEGLISFEGDFLFFVYILALGKFMMILAAMDTGSGFEGMGANREALYSMLVEPAFFILMGALALFTNTISFFDLNQYLHLTSQLSYLIAFTAIYVLFFIVMVENSRLPVDDPKTHLELTMVHEVMVLDTSGFDLALIQIAGWIKFSIYTTLISNFILPVSWPFYIQVIAFFVIVMITSSIIGLLESFKARNKLLKNPQWILMLSAIAVVAFLTTLIISQKIILH